MSQSIYEKYGVDIKKGQPEADHDLGDEHEAEARLSEKLPERERANRKRNYLGEGERENDRQPRRSRVREREQESDLDGMGGTAGVHV
eukprot:2341129-Rhodomonas_salina.5